MGVADIFTSPTKNRFSFVHAIGRAAGVVARDGKSGDLRVEFRIVFAEQALGCHGGDEVFVIKVK